MKKAESKNVILHQPNCVCKGCEEYVTKLRIENYRKSKVNQTPEKPCI